MGAYIPMLTSQAKDLGFLPKDLTCSYFLAHCPDYWSPLEIYRDLNHGHQLNKIAPPVILHELLVESGMVSAGATASSVKVDLIKAAGAVHDLKFHNIGNILDVIYGGGQTEFVYGSREYRIEDLLRVAKMISAAAEKMERATVEGIQEVGKFHVLGRRSLGRFLGITLDEDPLIDLFCADGSEESDPRFQPLVHVGNVYYVVPC